MRWCVFCGLEGVCPQVILCQWEDSVMEAQCVWECVRLGSGLFFLNTSPFSHNQWHHRSFPQKEETVLKEPLAVQLADQSCNSRRRRTLPTELTQTQTDPRTLFNMMEGECTVVLEAPVAGEGKKQTRTSWRTTTVLLAFTLCLAAAAAAVLLFNTHNKVSPTVSGHITLWGSWAPSFSNCVFILFNQVRGPQEDSNGEIHFLCRFYSLNICDRNVSRCQIRLFSKTKLEFVAISSWVMKINLDKWQNLEILNW